MQALPCARCKQLNVGKAGNLCIRCTFATQTHAERVELIDRAKAEQEVQARRKSDRTLGMRNRTFPYPKIKTRYVPPRPYRQNPNPASCNAKVIREMKRWGTSPGYARTRFVPKALGYDPKRFK